MNGGAMRTIAVANEKGGVGKTATVINLGAALASHGKQILIVDMDPQCNATYGVGIEPDDDHLTTYDLITNPKAGQVHDAILETEWEGLHIIPSHTDLAGAEIALISKIGRENMLKKALQPITNTYDFILLDTPPSLSLLTVNVFAYANEVLVPCQTQPYAFSALNNLFDTIESIKEDINPEIEITGIVATFFDKRTNISHNIMDKLRGDERYKNLILSTVIRGNTTIADSTNVGKPLIFYKKDSFGTVDYLDLAKELLALNQSN